MFGTLGGPELILIVVIALIVFGPRRLPDIGKSVGKMLVEFRRASNDFKRTIEDEVESEKAREAAPKPVLAAAIAPPGPEAPAAEQAQVTEASNGPDAAPAAEPAPSSAPTPVAPEGAVSRSGPGDPPQA